MTLAVDDATWKQYLADRQSRVRTNPVPEFVAVEGVHGNLSQRIEEKTANLTGKPIDFDQLDQEIMRLKGTQRYSALSYQMVERNGQQGLLIKTEETEVGPPVVQPLILIDGSSLKNVTFDMGARLTWFDIGGFRSEWRNDIVLFSDYGLNSEYYHPFTPLTHWFIAPRGLADNNPLYLYDNNQLLSTYRRTTLGGGLDVGYQFGRTGELRVGYEGGWQDFVRQVGNPNELPSFSGGYGDSRIQYRLDRLDDAVIPFAGQSFQGDRFSGTTPVRRRPNRIRCSKAPGSFTSG